MEKTNFDSIEELYFYIKEKKYEEIFIEVISLLDRKFMQMEALQVDSMKGVNEIELKEEIPAEFFTWLKYLSIKGENLFWKTKLKKIKLLS